MELNTVPIFIVTRFFLLSLDTWSFGFGSWVGKARWRNEGILSSIGAQHAVLIKLHFHGCIYLTLTRTQTSLDKDTHYTRLDIY